MSKADKAQRREERDEFVEGVARSKPSLFSARDRERLAKRERERDQQRQKGSGS